MELAATATGHHRARNISLRAGRQMGSHLSSCPVPSAPSSGKGAAEIRAGRGQMIGHVGRGSSPRASAISVKALDGRRAHKARQRLLTGLHMHVGGVAQGTLSCRPLRRQPALQTVSAPAMVATGRHDGISSDVQELVADRAREVGIQVLSQRLQMGMGHEGQHRRCQQWRSRGSRSRWCQRSHRRSRETRSTARRTRTIGNDCTPRRTWPGGVTLPRRRGRDSRRA